jgi:hypothetical protein
MRKVFPLASPGKDPQRVLEAVKRDVNSYLKRERRKSLPEGADYWAFDCAVGPSRSEPTATHVAELGGALDRAAEAQWPEVYVEILAKSAQRQRK